MVATASLSSKSPARVSEQIQGGFPQPDVTGPEPSLSEAVFEEAACHTLVKVLEKCRSRSKQTKLCCSKVLVSKKLSEEIAQDVLWLSSTEPCETGNAYKKLDRIACDPSVVPTFDFKNEQPKTSMCFTFLSLGQVSLEIKVNRQKSLHFAPKFFACPARY
uniref:DNA damage-inducible transcript 4-like protein n=1 Tax=Apteryx owenii TaxID=8824 RepID=A0A8B9PCB2_APTOW